MARKTRRRGRRVRKRGNWFTRMSAGKRIALCVSGILMCLLASGVVYVAAKLGKIETQDIPSEDIIINDLAEDVGEGYTNVALFGIDSREGELESGTRSDCIIVVSLNNATKEIRMVSVYRDTLLDIKNGDLQKCNAAYSFGGPEQAINMLNRNLDLDIQDYVTVDFAAVADAIDLLGGIEIDVKEEEVPYVNQYIAETASVAGKEGNFLTQAGLQSLDGVQATTYARIRSTAGGDFTRTERQRLVIEKMAQKAQKSNLVTINNIIDSVFPKVKTSFSITEILAYAKDFAKYKIGNSQGFPFEKSTDTLSGLGSIVIPTTLESNVKKLHEFLYDNPSYTTSSQVTNISGAIIGKLGEREAEDENTLNNELYPETTDNNAGWTDPSYGNADTTGTWTDNTSGAQDGQDNGWVENDPGTGQDPGIETPPGTDESGAGDDSDNSSDAGTGSDQGAEPLQ